MNKKAGKIIVANLVAASMLAAFPLAACNPTPPTEEGTAVIFNYNDNNSRPYTVYAGDDGISAPANPIRTGYTFDGWFTDPDNGEGEEVTFESKYVPTEETTLYAHWTVQMLNVNLHINDGTDSVETEVVEYGTVLEEDDIDAPTWDGHEFFYWQNAAENGTRITFPYIVRHETDFYAYWVEGLYTITFDLGEDNTDIERIEQGAELVIPDRLVLPSRTGHNFLHWSLEEDGEALPENYVPTGNVTLYAVWQVQTYRIRANTAYGPVTSRWFHDYGQVAYGSQIENPGTPTRTDYDFLGWYTNDVGGEEITFPYTITGAITLYAHWKHVPVVVAEDEYFEAEYTYIDPNEEHHGYSGSATGTDIILEDTGSYEASNGWFVAYQNDRGNKVTFEIESDRAVSGVTLIASLAVEGAPGLVIGPTGPNSCPISVNGTPISYTPVDFAGRPNIGGNQVYQCPFMRYTLGNINLIEGTNTIEFLVDNDTALGGGIAAAGFKIDYIQLTNRQGAELSWTPIFNVD